jgi:predicted PurR-regulated permease PerM
MKPQAKQLSAQKSWIAAIVAISFLFLCYLVYPLIDGLILGTVFAYLGRPIKRCFGKQRLIGSTVATVCIVLPVTLVIGLGTIELLSQMLWMATHQKEVAALAVYFFESVSIPDTVYFELSGSTRSLLEMAAGLLGGFPVFDVGRSFSMGLINFILALLVCFFLLLDGDRLEGSLLMNMPKKGVEMHRRYFARIDHILSGIFLGSIYSAIAGGLISAFVFLAFGVPHPFALALVVFMAGMVPVLTAWMVIIPITAYRYFLMGTTDAIVFFAISSALIYLPSELLIRPYLVSVRSTLHPLLVMVSFLDCGILPGASFDGRGGRDLPD